MDFAARKATGIIIPELGSSYVATHRRFDERKLLSSSAVKGGSDAMNDSAGIELNTADAELSISGRKGISVDVASRTNISFLSLGSGMVIDYNMAKGWQGEIKIVFKR